MELTPFNPAADFTQVARLAGQLGYPSTEAQVRARYAGIGSRSDHAILVAREGGAVIGWVHLCARLTLASDARLEILGLVVDESFRGRGVGSLLIAGAEDWGRGHGLKRVRFTSQVVREDAHRLYRRLGYEVTKTSHVFEKILGD